MENDEVLEFDVNSSFKKERTSLLTTASVLSWIMGGLMVLTCGIFVLLKTKLFELLEEAGSEFDATQREAVNLLMDNFDKIFLFNLIAYAVSIFAVIMMYRLKKIGFFIYTPLHVAMTVYPYTYQEFSLDGGTIFNFAITIGFIVMYGVNLKHMD